MQFSERYHFSDWPNKKIPLVAAGVYAIWKSEVLIYCGMSGREYEKAKKLDRKKYGLITRLHSHASGRLSSDQFCVYVANRLVIPELKHTDLSRFANGEYRLDHFTKRFIHKNLDYQYVVVESSKEAYEVEAQARSGVIFGQKPLLNPINS